MAINKAKVQAAAQKFWSKGNWDKCLREYQKLVDDDPRDVRSLTKIGDLYAKMKQPKEAVATYTAVARLYMDDDLHERASAVLRGALNHDGSNADLNRSLGEAYHRMGRLKDAVIWYNRAQELYKEANDVRAQREVLERMVQLDPEDIALRIKLAERYVKDGKSDDALAIFKYAANHFEDEGRFDDFAKVAERVIYLEPRDAEMRRKIVANAMDRQDYKRALRHLQYLFKQDDKDQETLRTLAFVFRQMGNKEKAVQVYNHLAKVMWDEGDQQQAMRVWEQVLEINPQDGQARKMVEYDRKRRAAELKREEEQLRARRLEDSGSMPGLNQNTGNLGVRDSTDSSGGMGAVEFLDDDLGDLLGGFQQAPPQRAPQPQHQPQRVQAHSAPQQQPQGNQSNDLLSFAQDAFGDLGGDIAFENLQAMPGQGHTAPSQAEPEVLEILDVEPVEILEVVPVEEHPDESPEVRKSIDEARVFLKYGLRPKAIQSLITLIARHPRSEEARLELVGIYEKQGEANMAVDQLLELARLYSGRGVEYRPQLERAAMLMQDWDYVAMMAGEMGLEMPEQPAATVQPASYQNQLSEPSFGDLTEEDISLDMLSGLVQDTDAGDGIELADDDIIELDDDELISEVGEADLVHEATDVDMRALPSEPSSGGFENFAFTEDDADAMFDDLFADVAPSQQNVGMASLSSFGELSQNDQDAVASIIDASLGGQRKLDIGNMRTGENPFAERVASGAFDAMFDSGNYEGISSTPSAVSIGEAVNTNFELGMAYMEMGNYAEAVEEFRQAIDDPDVFDISSVNLANCEWRLGHADVARGRLQHLLGDHRTSPRVRAQAQRLLDKIGR